MNVNVWVEVDRSASAGFTFVPSPVAGGNLGFIVGIERGADLWMRGRGEDGVVRHEMAGHTTYRFRADLSGETVCAVGPIAATVEVLGRAVTRNVGPLKTFVHWMQSGFSVFGDEAEVRAQVRAGAVADGGRMAAGNACAGGERARFEVPAGAGRPVPPLEAQALERKELVALEHAHVAGGAPPHETPPFRVGAHAAIECLESGFPGGAHAAGEVETRHHVDVVFRLCGPAGAVQFLRWTSGAGFDEPSRALLAPAARKKDDAWKEAAAREKDLRAAQERAYAAEEGKLAGYAAGLGVDARKQAELAALDAEVAEHHLPDEEARARAAAIDRAYEKKAADNARDRKRLEGLVATVRRRWEEALAPSASSTPAPSPAAPSGEGAPAKAEPVLVAVGLPEDGPDGA